MKKRSLLKWIGRGLLLWFTICALGVVFYFFLQARLAGESDGIAPYLILGLPLSLIYSLPAFVLMMILCWGLSRRIFRNIASIRMLTIALFIATLFLTIFLAIGIWDTDAQKLLLAFSLSGILMFGTERRYFQHLLDPDTQRPAGQDLPLDQTGWM